MVNFKQIIAIVIGAVILTLVRMYFFPNINYIGFNVAWLIGIIVGRILGDLK